MFEEDLDDRDMALIDGDMERGLFPTVASIQVDSVLGEQLQDVRLITKAGMVDGPITIFVLHMYTHNIVYYNIARNLCLQGENFRLFSPSALMGEMFVPQIFCPVLRNT